MMNNNISKFNKVANYMNVSAELQNCHKEVPVNAAFAIRDGETIHATFMPYEATPVETILSRFDEIDFAILEEIGRSKYLTSLQIYQFILLRGLSVKRQGIRNRLKKLMRLRMIHEYESRVGEGGKGNPVL